MTFGSLTARFFPGTQQAADIPLHPEDLSEWQARLEQLKGANEIRLGALKIAQQESLIHAARKARKRLAAEKKEAEKTHLQAVQQTKAAEQRAKGATSAAGKIQAQQDHRAAIQLEKVAKKDVQTAGWWEKLAGRAADNPAVIPTKAAATTARPPAPPAPAPTPPKSRRLPCAG